jgi:hypothetical protein
MAHDARTKWPRQNLANSRQVRRNGDEALAESMAMVKHFNSLLAAKRTVRGRQSPQHSFQNIIG